MGKDSFLDTNVIVNYAHYKEDQSIEIIKRCYSYITNKSEKFIICYAVFNELFKVIEKLSIIHKNVLAKVENNNHPIEKNRSLSEQDISFAEKLYLTHKQIELKKLSEIFASEREIFEIKIEQFLKYQLDERVIPIKDIKIELVNIIWEMISNYADCRILTSAIQAQQERDIFYFVTADKHFDLNDYDFIKEDLRFKEYKFPELNNLLYNN